MGDIGGVHLIDVNGNPLGTAVNPLTIAGGGATLRVNAGGAAVGQTLKTYVGTLSVAAAVTLTLETVTPGKTFYITDIYVGSNTATVFPVTVNAGATAVFQGFCKGDTGPISLMGIETQPSASSGTVVQLLLGAAAATTCAFMVNGYEQ